MCNAGARQTVTIILRESSHCGQERRLFTGSKEIEIGVSSQHPEAIMIPAESLDTSPEWGEKQETKRQKH